MATNRRLSNYGGVKDRAAYFKNYPKQVRTMVNTTIRHFAGGGECCLVLILIPRVYSGGTPNAQAVKICQLSPKRLQLFAL